MYHIYCNTSISNVNGDAISVMLVNCLTTESVTSVILTACIHILYTFIAPAFISEVQ